MRDRVACLKAGQVLALYNGHDSEIPVKLINGGADSSGDLTLSAKPAYMVSERRNEEVKKSPVEEAGR
jgi:hypothetical protein